ncbi:MAG: hypothetical protein LKM36_10300 [Flavobacteriales bacterium]|nr:hypothetical protein [Flavobacteriales bacterium]
MLRNSLFLAAFACAIAAQAQAQALYADVRVGLLGLGTPHAVMVMGDQGPLDIWADGKKVAQLDANDGLSVRATTQGITAKSLVLDLSAKKKIEFRSPLGRGFRVRTTEPKGAERAYPGVCEVRAEKGGLRLVATVPLEEYVAGTVQSEAGEGARLGILQVTGGELPHLRAGEQAQACGGKASRCATVPIAKCSWAATYRTRSGSPPRLHATLWWWTPTSG